MSLADKIIFSSEQEVIKEIDNGADVNEYDQYGFRPLIEAIICKKPQVLQYLLDNGADIEQVDILGRSPLQWAADRSSFEDCNLLLERGAKPNHYSADGQPILVYPILREEYDLIKLFVDHGAEYKFAQDFISAKLIGHRFELTGEVDITTPDEKFIPLSFEGFYLEFTCDLIQRSLNNYIHSIPGQRFEKFHAKLNKALMALQHAGQLMTYSRHKDRTPFDSAINAILDNELLIIPVGHKGHAITFVKYHNLWIKCDRGVDRFADTVLIYKLKNPYAVTKQFLKDLIYTKKTDDFIIKEIKEILGLEYLQKLPTNSQLAGNCSWANVEASVQASLFALCYVEANEDRIETANLKRSIVSFDSAWVEWDKDTALDELISDFETAEPPRNISKAVILSIILVQRCHYTLKNQVQRAKKIISCLARPQFTFLLKSVRNTYNKTRAGKVGKSVVKLLELCDVNLKDLTIKNHIKPKAISEYDIKMTTALHVASLKGQLESVQYLLDKLHMDVNYQDRTGSTALMYAAWQGHFDIVKYLVEKHNANISIVNLKGGTAKRYAQYAGKNEIAEYLNKHQS